MPRRILIAGAAVAILAACGAAAPTRSPAAAPSASPTGSAATEATATASLTAAPPTTAPPTAGPLEFASATFPAAESGLPSIAPGPDGGVWVVVVNSTLQAPSSTVGLLGPDLKPRAGWPLRIKGWICGDGNFGGWAPQPTASGAVRIVCVLGDGGVGDPLLGIELDASGRLTGTWHSPVRFSWGYQPLIVDDRLVGFGRDEPDRDGETEPPTLRSTYWITSTGPDGAILEGPHVTARTDSAWGVALGPDGTGYLFDELGVSAFGMAGPLPGWPIDLAADRSLPGFQGLGAVVVTQTAEGTSPMRLLRLGDGRVDELSSSLAMAPIPAFHGASLEDRAIAPLVTGWITTALGRTSAGLIVRRFTDTEQHGGWPFETGGSLDTQGDCGGPVFTPGCGVWTTLPVMAADGTLLLPVIPRSGAGPQIVAVDSDGRQRAGWPVVVGGSGTHVWSLAADGLGGVYAVVVGGSAGGSAGVQVVSIAPDGTVRARLTVAND